MCWKANRKSQKLFPLSDFAKKDVANVSSRLAESLCLPFQRETSKREMATMVL